MLFIFSCPGFAQVTDTTAVDSSAIQMERPGMMGESAQDTLAREEDLPEPGQVTPWQEEWESDNYFVTNDSLMPTLA